MSPEQREKMVEAVAEVEIAHGYAHIVINEGEWVAKCACGWRHESGTRTLAEWMLANHRAEAAVDALVEKGFVS